MSKYGYVGKENDIPQQAFKSNAGVLSVNDHLALRQEDKLTQFGQLELIETQSVTTNVAQVDFDTLNTDKYNVHFLTANNMKNASDDQQFSFRFKVNGSVVTANDYQRSISFGNTAPTNGESRDTATSANFFTLNQGNATNEKGNGYAYFYNLGDSTKYSFSTYQSTYIDSGGNYKYSFGSFVYDVATTVDGISIIMSNGSNIADGEYSLYGMKEYS